MMKHVWGIRLLALAALCFALPGFAQTPSEMLPGAPDLSNAKGYLPVSPEQIPRINSRTLLYGNVDITTPNKVIPLGAVQTIPQGTVLKLILMDMLASGYNDSGDVFHASVAEDVTLNNAILIPKGTLIHGHVDSIKDAGRTVVKNGKLGLVLDYILMPDGRKIDLKTTFNRGDSNLAAVGKGVGSALGSAIGGGIRGVLVGFQYGGGLAGAAFTNGLTAIGGGGLGLAAGLESGFHKSGQNVLLQEGDLVRVALQDPLPLPSMTMPPDTDNEIALPGLTVSFQKYLLGRDPFRVENQINLTVTIQNQTPYSFGSFDIALVDEYNTVYTQSPFGQSDSILFEIPSGRAFSGVLSFSVKSPALRHYLIFYKPYTREIAAKISLSEALKHLEQAKSTKRKR